MTHYKCVAVSVSAEILPSACIFLFCCVQDVSGRQPLGSGCVAPPANNRAQGVRCDQLPDCKHVGPPEVCAL